MDTLVYNSNNHKPKTNNMFFFYYRTSIFGTHYSFHNFEQRSSDVVFLQHEKMYFATDPNTCMLLEFQLQ